MSELKPCPFCGSAFVGKSYISYAPESAELAILSEQIKVLRAALEACIDLLSNLENIGGFVGLAVINNGQMALDQTKPKDGK